MFWAFSQKQFNEGIKRINLQEGEKVIRIDGGGFIAKNDYQKFKNIMGDFNKKLLEDNPQDVYNYEYRNCECGYIYDDFEAIRRVIETFGADIARGIKRKNDCISIDDIVKAVERGHNV
jgi:hypothetical protein